MAKITTACRFIGVRDCLSTQRTDLYVIGPPTSMTDYWRHDACDVRQKLQPVGLLQSTGINLNKEPQISPIACWTTTQNMYRIPQCNWKQECQSWNENKWLLVLKCVKMRESETFLSARRYASGVHDVIAGLSVSLSVTSQYSTKMAKPRITQTTPYDSTGTLVFCYQRSR